MTCSILSDGSELSYVCRNESEPAYRNIKFMILETVNDLYRQGYDTFITNCEYGIPLWSAEIIAGLKKYNNIALNIIIPYEEQATNWSEDLRDRYFNVHAVSDFVNISSTRYSENCYDTAYQHMIDNSDAVLVFGKQTSDIYAISYAKSKGILIIYKNIAEQ